MAAKIGECALESKFSFEVLNSDFDAIYLADGENFTWAPWYEEYGKQWYWNGPEVGENFLSNEVFKAGVYYIKVFNSLNVGQYVIAVGDIEQFSFTDIVGLIFSMGDIEDEFWNPDKCNRLAPYISHSQQITLNILRPLNTIKFWLLSRAQINENLEN